MDTSKVHQANGNKTGPYMGLHTGGDYHFPPQYKCFERQKKLNINPR